MSRHKQLLEITCRVCGRRGLLNSTRHKHDFTLEMKEIFKIDVTSDQNDVHPEKICRTHEQFLLKYRAFKNERTGKQFRTSLQVADFQPHSTQCNICKKPSVGRKRKQTGVKKFELKCVSSFQEDSQDDNNEVELTDSSFNEPDNQIDIGHKSNDSSMNKYSIDYQRMLNDFDELDELNRMSFLKEFAGRLSSSESTILAFEIGKQQSQNIAKDIDDISYQYSDKVFLENFEPTQWLSNRNLSLVHFIQGITNVSFESSPEYIQLSFCRIIEQIYRLKNQKLVAPISFLISLNIFSKTSSRSVVDLLCKTTPSGSYTTLQKWISKSGSDAPPCPKGLIMAGFDNEQVISYKRGISPNQKSKSSVITTNLYAELHNDSSKQDIQQKEAHKPKNWFNIKHFDEKMKSIRYGVLQTDEKQIQQDKNIFIEGIKDIRDQTNKEYEDLEKIHFEQLHHFIKIAIETTIAEHKHDGEELVDEIDINTHEQERLKDILICALCGAENARNKQKCADCNQFEGIRTARQKRKTNDFCNQQQRIKRSKIEEIVIGEREENEEGYQRYEHIQSNHNGPASITLGMPTFVNPNSNEAVSLVLRHIGLNCGVKRYGGEDREWAFVCCDGRPHSLYHKLLDECVVCIHCSKSFTSRGEYKKHHKSNHTDLPPSCAREFDWIYMRIGAGHLEMNAFKAFFELNWVPYLEKMSEIMGFTSENAKHFAKSCKDHHVAWQLLLTFHTSGLREMVLPFIRSLQNAKTEATVENYFKFYKQFLAHNPNHAYLHLQLCRFSQALINLRMGIRRNNAELVKSAKFHLKELFYGRNHPHYQNIELFDCIQYKFMPDDVKTVWDRNVSFTVSGNPSKGQDLDFILEEKNKAIKQYLPTGSVPSDETWKSICCNLSFFETLQEKISCLLDLQPQKEYGTKTIDISGAINYFRPILRKHLTNMTDSHVSVDGKQLHPNLINFLEYSTLKRQAKINENILGITTEAHTLQPVFITNEEENLYQKKMTKAELTVNIKAMIKELNKDLKTHYTTVLESLTDGNTNKDTFLTLYFELQDVTSSSSSELDQ